MSSYSIQLLVAAVIVPSTLFLTQHEVLLTLSNISRKLCILHKVTGFTASYKRKVFNHCSTKKIICIANVISTKKNILSKMPIFAKSCALILTQDEVLFIWLCHKEMKCYSFPLDKELFMSSYGYWPITIGLRSIIS